LAKISPVSFKTLVKRLKIFGFEGPYPGGKHPYMIKRNIVLTLPNPHKKEISVDLLIRILRQADIDKEKWQEIAK